MTVQTPPQVPTPSVTGGGVATVVVVAAGFVVVPTLARVFPTAVNGFLLLLLLGIILLNADRWMPYLPMGSLSAPQTPPPNPKGVAPGGYGAGARNPSHNKTGGR